MTTITSAHLLFVLLENFLGKLGMLILPDELQKYFCEVHEKEILMVCVNFIDEFVQSFHIGTTES
jgi:hypothetical protein